MQKKHRIEVSEEVHRALKILAAREGATTKELASRILKDAIDKDTKGYMTKGLKEPRVLKSEEHKIEEAKGAEKDIVIEPKEPMVVRPEEPLVTGPEEPMVVSSEEEKSQKPPEVPGWEREDGVAWGEKRKFRLSDDPLALKELTKLKDDGYKIIQIAELLGYGRDMISREYHRLEDK